MSTIALPLQPSSRLASRIGFWLSRRWHLYREKRARQATIAILSALSDTTLKDIGLHRSEIASLAFDATGERLRSLTRHARCGRE